MANDSLFAGPGRSGGAAHPGGRQAGADLGDHQLQMEVLARAEG
ncbi:hypothetical protein [Amycolatopsis orientalis]|nr:hypothetical protein [Amycolatopsis orientalis]